MKRIKKKVSKMLLSLTMVFAITLSMMPMNVFAAGMTSATISDVTVTGYTNVRITSNSAIITLQNGKFNYMGDYDITSNCENVPSGITMKLQVSTDNPSVGKLKFSGTPTVVANDPIKISIPSHKLSPSAEDVTVTINSNAKWAITKNNLDDAKPLAELAITGITATNSTTAENILGAISASISTVTDVIASWKNTPTITPATKNTEGTITGTIVLTYKNLTSEVTVNKTIAKLPKTDAEKIDEAKPLAQTAITGITATNDTTAENILETVTDGISSVTGVTVSWKETPTITKATSSADGSITGTIVLTCGNETAEVSVNKTINKLTITDKEKLDEAKPLAQAAITEITATNDTTAGNILETVTDGISSVTGVTASWKETPTITKATSSADGSITGTIILTSGNETVEVSVNKTINKLTIIDKEKLDEAKPLALAAITEITATNDTTAGNILETVTDGISSVTGVTASWKETPTITKATASSVGSITGTIILTCGGESVEVTVNKTIAMLQTPTPEKPTITVGNSGTSHQISSGKDMLFTCSGALEDLTGVYVDGKLVDESNYTLKSGSTILTLKASYLDTLSAGKHTLKFQYKENISAETEFTITTKAGETPTQKPETPNNPSTPETGDTSNSMLYMGLIALSGCVACFGVKKKKYLN